MVKNAAIAGWSLAAIFFGLWLNVREDLASEIERCNTDKLSAALQAEKVTREAVREATAAKEREMRLLQQQTEKAIEIATQAVIEAENRPVQVRTVIERIRDQDACIDTVVHPDLLGCLRSDQDCRDTSSR